MLRVKSKGMFVGSGMCTMGPWTDMLTAFHLIRMQGRKSNRPLFDSLPTIHQRFVAFGLLLELLRTSL
jgi:hypothetical protein